MPKNYADPGKRLVAYIIDLTILSVVLGILANVTILPLVFSLIYSSDAAARTDEQNAAIILSSFMFIIVCFFVIWMLNFLYFTLQHSSKFQATFGKRAMKIYVTDEFGKRMSFGRAALRYLGRIINGLTMSIGFLIILFTEKKQGLHDIIAKTLVLDGTKDQDVDELESL